jgi:hypothetical protein
MASFGKCGGGGRRVAPRVAGPLSAIVSTRTYTACGAVEDLSCTGLRLRGKLLFQPTDDVLLNIEGVTTFGTVVWSDAGACGVEFDEPLPSEHFHTIDQSLRQAKHSLSAEEELALSDWNSGFTR